MAKPADDTGVSSGLFNYRGVGPICGCHRCLDLVMLSDYHGSDDQYEDLTAL